MRITQTQFMSQGVETFELVGDVAETAKQSLMHGLWYGTHKMYRMDHSFAVVARFDSGMVDVFWEISD